MKPQIMIIDDNDDFLFNIKFALEKNGFEVITARNGREGINFLASLAPHDNPPDIIISDILMPEMDGYDFFDEVSKNERWFQIPFVFLTALSSTEHIRLGKKLGVDDYITKPFEEDDLIAIINGKIARKEKIDSITKEIDKNLSKIKDISKIKRFIKPSISENDKKLVFLTIFTWDLKLGPQLQYIYPIMKPLSYSIESVGVQLYHSAISIYGTDYLDKPQGLLLKIENIDMCGYVFFDLIIEETGPNRFMVAVISPRLNFFDSLEIKQILQEISSEFKKNKDLDVKKYWERILDVLSTPQIK